MKRREHQPKGKPKGEAAPSRTATAKGRPARRPDAALIAFLDPSHELQSMTPKAFRAAIEASNLAAPVRGFLLRVAKILEGKGSTRSKGAQIAEAIEGKWGRGRRPIHGLADIASHTDRVGPRQRQRYEAINRSFREIGAAAAPEVAAVQAWAAEHVPNYKAYTLGALRELYDARSRDRK